MGEIIFEDILDHYQIKLKEIFDDIEFVRMQIEKSENLIDMNWYGLSADACQEKLISINHELTKTLAEISNANTKISEIKENLDLVKNYDL